MSVDWKSIHSACRSSVRVNACQMLFMVNEPWRVCCATSRRGPVPKCLRVLGPQFLNVGALDHLYSVILFLNLQIGENTVLVFRKSLGKSDCTTFTSRYNTAKLRVFRSKLSFPCIGTSHGSTYRRYFSEFRKINM